MATPTFPTPFGEDVVGIVSNLRWKVEGDAQAGLPLLQEILITPVRFPQPVANPEYWAHRPEATAIHGGLDTAGERELSGKSEIAAIICLRDIKGV